MPRMNIKPALRRTQSATSQRYERRFVNGVHTVFDRQNFGHGLPLGTQREAERVVADLNSGKRQWTA